MTYKLESLIKTGFKKIGSLYWLSIFFNFLLILVSCQGTDTARNITELSKIRTDIPKANYLHYPSYVYQDSTSFLLDCSLGNYFLTANLLTGTRDTVILPKDIQKQFFKRVSRDSIIFFPRNFRSLYFMVKGKVQKVSLGNISKLYEITQPLTSGFAFIDNKLILPVASKQDGSPMKTYYRKVVDNKIIAVIDLKDNTIELMGSYPEIEPYLTIEDRYRRIEYNFQFVVNNKKEIIISFPRTQFLYTYSLKGELLKQSKSEVEIPRCQDKNRIPPFLGSFSYDRYRNKYYLCGEFWDKKEKDIYQTEKSWKLFVLDSNLKNTRQIDFKQKDFYPARIEIIKEGVLLTKNFTKNEEDTSKNKTFTLVDGF